MGSSLQLSFVIVRKPPGPCSSNTGSANGSGTPRLTSEGPIARKRICLDAIPVMINPPMPAFSPLWTFMRVERLMVCDPGPGVMEGVAVGIDEGAGVTVAVAVGDGVGLLLL